MRNILSESHMKRHLQLNCYLTLANMSVLPTYIRYLPALDVNKYEVLLYAYLQLLDMFGHAWIGSVLVWKVCEGL